VKKKMTFMLAALFTLLLVLSACTTGESAPAGAGASAPASTPASQASEAEPQTRTVIDHMGNEVVLPAKIERIVIAGLTPLPSVFCMVTGSTDLLVGIDPAAQNAAAHSIMNKAFPELAQLPTTFLVDNVMNVEELIKLNPDVVFNHAGMPEHHEATVAAGIPSVQFSVSLFKDENFNTVKTVNAWVELIGQVLGIETTSEETIAYGENAAQMVAGTVATIPEDERKDVLMLYNYNGNVITAAGQTFGKYWVTACGGNYLTDDITAGSAEIDMERVYEMNPEVIFLSSFSAYTPEDFFNNTLGEGHDWSSIKAVQDGRVYKFPLGTYYWYPPNADAALALQWFAKSLYPEYFETLDLDGEVKSYYLEHYGVEVTDEDLEQIYYPLEESATNW
jgi:iron complex transport system substrate-binding protein